MIKHENGHIQTEIAGHKATITINSPARRNALTSMMWVALAEAFQAIGTNPTVRVVLLTGAGNLAFSAGADIKEFATARRDRAQAIEYADLCHQATQAIVACPAPVVAAIQGVCTGGGLELASCCDIRLCNASARFGIPINRLGITADYDELAAFLRVMSACDAMDLLLTGRLIGSRDALGKGVVSRIFEDANFLVDVNLYLNDILEGAPLASRWHKMMLNRLVLSEPITVEEQHAPFAVFDSEDYLIGVDAFSKKHVPKFVGR